MRALPLSLLVAAGSLAACSRPATQAAAPPSAPREVVAVVDGHEITLEEVDRRAAGALARLRHDEYQVRTQALDELIGERLLTREAEARGATAEEILKAEVEGRVSGPSREEVSSLLRQHAGRFAGRPPEEAAAEIETALRRQRLAERDRAYRDELRQRAAVRITLREPRVNLDIPADAPTLGPAGAPVTLVEFLDYNCGYCRRVQGALDAIMKEYDGRVRFVHRDYLIGNPASLPPARALRCAADQGRFWEYHRSLLLEEGDLGLPDLKRRAARLRLDEARFAECAGSSRFDDAIRASVEAGDALGVSGTPTFFINGRRLGGARGVEEFRKAIEEELARS